MGCCSSRSPLYNSLVRKSMNDFIESTKLNLFSCLDIKRLDAQILSENMDQETYELFAKGWGINASYEMFSSRGVVHKFDLKVSLMLFSSDFPENKIYLLKEMLNGCPRRLMQFLEWRYRLINDKIPNEMQKFKILERNDAKEWIGSTRFRAGSEIINSFYQIKNDERMINTLNLLNIN
ncbi:hypothetical protein SteCoe_18909 [Stentor coeruleus]|uniref:Uncharacterized protein n=1 Tax=Stentor coeruleus TaxID=5963 RepID=A0A1R2BVN2_9CILI|nr:hypothetical protein SteCoe_18909 [Stentor coeruleus]